VLDHFAIVKGPELPECSDGIDNDGDGDLDYPADPLCRGTWDDDEMTNKCGLLGAEALLFLAGIGAWNRLGRKRAPRHETEGCDPRGARSQAS
jgi:hypothetical protein